MADIKDLEIRLKQCQDVMTNVIENLNYIDRELRLAKQNNNTSSVSPADSFPSRGSQSTQPGVKAQQVNQQINPQINQPANQPINHVPYQTGAPVNQGAYNQGTVNQNRPQNVPPQGATNNRNPQSTVSQGTVNQGPVNQNRPQNVPPQSANIPPQGPASQNRAPQGQPVYTAPNYQYGNQNRTQNRTQNGAQNG